MHVNNFLNSWGHILLKNPLIAFLIFFNFSWWENYIHFVSLQCSFSSWYVGIVNLNKSKFPEKSLNTVSGMMCKWNVSHNKSSNLLNPHLRESAEYFSLCRMAHFIYLSSWNSLWSRVCLQCSYCFSILHYLYLEN